MASRMYFQDVLVSSQIIDLVARPDPVGLLAFLQEREVLSCCMLSLDELRKTCSHSKPHRWRMRLFSIMKLLQNSPNFLTQKKPAHVTYTHQYHYPIHSCAWCQAINSSTSLWSLKEKASREREILLPGSRHKKRVQVNRFHVFHSAYPMFWSQSSSTGLSANSWRCLPSTKGSMMRPISMAQKSTHHTTLFKSKPHEFLS